MTDTSCLIVIPVVENETCEPLNVVASDSVWGEGPQTVPNPCPVGGSIIYISAAPGQGFDAGGETWIDPPGASFITEAPNDPAAVFIPRGRVWVGPNPGTPTITFGWQANGNITSQTSAVICIDGEVTTAQASAWTSDATTNTDYAPVATPAAGTLVLPIAISQEDDRVTVGPAGFTNVLDMSTTDPTRLIRVDAANTATASTDPGPGTWNEATAGHRTVTVAVHCETVAQTCDLIPAESLTYLVDPADIGTWGPNRPAGQRVIAGEVYNVGDPFNGGTTVTSFAMEDGDTRRAYTETIGGVEYLVDATQFVDDGSYVYQPNVGFNTSINIPPSDPLFFDGTRSQWSDLTQPNGGDIVVGPGCTPVKYMQSFLVEEWMFMTSGAAPTMFFSFHTPLNSSVGTGPLQTNIIGGQINFTARTNPNNPAGLTQGVDDNNSTFGQTLGTYNLPPPGTRVTLIWDVCVDPTGGGYYRVYELNETTGACNTIVDHDHQFGYYFNSTNGGTALNSQFYNNFLTQYHFHAWPAATRPNWDSSTPDGNIRRMRTAVAMLDKGNTVTVGQMCDHARSVLGVC